MSTSYFIGTIFEAPERNTLKITEDALITVGEDGVITSVCDPKADKKAYDAALTVAESSGRLTRLEKGQYLMPGLIDLHVHAPQWPQLGKALDKPLEFWLQECTFPLEAKYEDVEFAARSYNSLVSTLLACGTTTVAYFASIHMEASVLLAQICIEKGQRAIVGRVAMDLPDQCPEYYRDPSPAESVARSEEFIHRVRALPNNRQLVFPAVIPRFIPSCSHEALVGLGELVQKYNCHVQTHCSESDWEHHHVLERYKKHDAFALDDFHLLTRQTVLAHCNYISTEDMELIKTRGSAVAHCPLSNVYFSDAVFPLKKALDMGVHVGMGTDISGGPSPSLFDTCRHAISSSRLMEDGTDPNLSKEARSQQKNVRTHPIEAFYVATTLGGESLNLKVGRLCEGYHFDAIVVDVTKPNTGLQIFEEIDTIEDVFQKIIYNVSYPNIVKTFVDGRLVHSFS